MTDSITHNNHHILFANTICITIICIKLICTVKTILRKIIVNLQVPLKILYAQKKCSILFSSTSWF